MAYPSRIVPVLRAPIDIGAGERCRTCVARPDSPCAALPHGGFDMLARVAAHTRL